MTVQPRFASTIMLVRDHAGEQSAMEVFMVRRVVQSEFMPDVYVFPGGSVSTDDRTTEETAGLCAAVPPSASDPEEHTSLGTGIRAAAIRELFEEANVLLVYHGEQMLAINPETLARFSSYRQAFHERRGSLVDLVRNEGLVLATDHLAYFAHWITPEGMPKRYDTHFFLATAPTEQEAAYDRIETSEGLWIQPGQALERFEDGSFPLAFPTYHQLRDLAQYRSVQEALDAAATKYVPTHQPLLKIIDGAPSVYLPEDPENAWNVQRA